MNNVVSLVNLMAFLNDLDWHAELSKQCNVVTFGSRSSILSKVKLCP